MDESLKYQVAIVAFITSDYGLWRVQTCFPRGI